MVSRSILAKRIANLMVRGLVEVLFTVGIVFCLVFLIGVALYVVSVVPFMVGVAFIVLYALLVGVLVMHLGRWEGQREKMRIARKKEAELCCRYCNYNLTGNISGICPECGQLVPSELKERLNQYGVSTEV